MNIKWLSVRLYELWHHRRIIRELRLELEIAKDMASAPLASKRAAEDQLPAPLKPIVLRRPSYAQAQAEWEWNHNHRAQELVQRAKDGFF